MSGATPAQLQEHQLHDRQLDEWLESDELAAADAWLERKRSELEPEHWCALLIDWSRRLTFTDRHAQAEEWLRTAVRQYPDKPELLGQLAELVQVQGRTREAIALLRRAIEVVDQVAGETDTRCFALWLRLSTIALPANPTLAGAAVERARDALTRSMQARGVHEGADGEQTLQLELALADYEARNNQPRVAEVRYRKILEQHPQRLGALQGLGQLMLQLGRIDEAIALFERLKTADSGRGYGALMRVRQFPDDEDTLHRLERAARTPGVEGSVRTGLLFQLAAAWENRERYDQAWALADEANTAARRLLSYDADEHRKRCARIRHAFPEALYQQRVDSGVTSTLPVFVVGMPRSGTTLVEQIIAGHSAIHGAGELGTIPQIIAGLERWERRTGSGRHYPDCVDDLDPTVLSGIAERTLQDLKAIASDASDTSEASDVRHVVDKLPHNFEHIGLIRLLFPNAKIISVRRDPRDIAISNYLMDYAAKHSGMGFAYDLDWIGEQLADHNLLMQHWHSVCPGEILEINYEDLIDKPELSARRLLTHIGVAWEPEVLDFHDLERSVKTASVWQVRQPLYASSKSRWQRYSNHLQPLIAATNRRIRSQPIEMITLPEPGWLNTGVDLFRRDDLDGAEYRFKQLLQHVPEHAAALYMLGLVYLQKGSLAAGVKLLEDALQRCPWNRHWRADLAQAYKLAGRLDDARALDVENAVAPPTDTTGQRSNPEPLSLDYLYFSEELACAGSGPSPAAG